MSTKVPWQAKVAVSVVIYGLAVSAIPIYNKEIFSGGRAGFHKFPYPIATAFMQLSSVSIALGVMNVIGHFARRRSSPEASWLFGPHFGYKLRHVAPVGILFGVKYGITNWGLELMDAGTHLLLQSTDLAWTVLVARCINKETLGLMEYVAAALVTAGSVLIGIHAGRTMNAPFLPLLVNCLTPLFLALCISTLRKGAKELFDPNNVLGGTVTPFEFTALKLALSGMVAFVLSVCVEGTLIHWHNRPDPWWNYFADQPPQARLALFGGAVFVLIFQVNITWLSGLTSAVTVGIVGSVKIVPQWFFNALFHMEVDLSFSNVGGAALVLSASILYAYSRLKAAPQTEKDVVEAVNKTADADTDAETGTETDSDTKDRSVAV